MNDKENENSGATCETCTHSMWLVGIGLGMRCKHPENVMSDNVPKLLPSRDFSCKHYETKDKDCTIKLD